MYNLKLRVIFPQEIDATNSLVSAFHFRYWKGKPLDKLFLLFNQSVFSPCLLLKSFIFSLDFTVMCFDMGFLFICPVLNALILLNLKIDAFSISENTQLLSFKIFSLPPPFLILSFCSSNGTYVRHLSSIFQLYSFYLFFCAACWEIFRIYHLDLWFSFLFS